MKLPKPSDLSKVYVCNEAEEEWAGERMQDMVWRCPLCQCDDWQAQVYDKKQGKRVSIERLPYHWEYVLDVGCLKCHCALNPAVWVPLLCQ